MDASKNAMQFSKNLLKLADAIDVDVSTVVRLEVLKLFSNIVRKSPVRTGVYRASHGIANMEPQGIEGIAQKPPKDTVVNVPPKPTWKWMFGDGTIWMYNNVPYAERIETGWSEQAPQGVYGLALMEFNITFGKIL